MKIYKEDFKGGDAFYRLGEWLGGWGGTKVTRSTLMQEGYLCNPFYYNITNRIAEKIASLPTKFIDSEGNTVDKSTPDISDFLQLMEDSEGGTKTFVEKNVANLIALGECFIYLHDKPVGFNEATGLQTISPVLVEPNTLGGSVQSRVRNFVITDTYVDDKGNERSLNIINPDSAIWGKLPNISPYTNRGLSPFEPNWDVVKATSNSFKAHGVLIENMGANGLLVPESGEGSMPATEKEQNFLQRALDNLLGGAKSFGKAIISRASMKWISIGIDPNKLEILKMQEQSLKVLCSAVNLDSKIFNDSSASTYNNLSEATKSSYDDCFIPYAETFFAFLTNALLPNGIKWMVDTDRIDVLNSRDYNFERETREGVISVQNQISEGKITVESGVKMLEMIYDISEDDARELLVVPESMQIIDIEGNATIEEGEKSQARFSEFGVGGVQGILAIQESVARGVTQYEAGISTLVLIYGLTEEDSRTILGDKKELENALSQNQNNQADEGF